MKRIIGTFAALALCAPMLASAAEGWVIADISLQAGPDTEYPSIMELSAGTPVSIQGCIEGWTWCDVIVGPERGWVPGTFLEEAYGGRRVVVVDYGPRIGIPVVSFSIGLYWDHYYRNRPFYAQRQEWSARSIQPHAPPRPSGGVVAHHADETRSAPATTTREQQRTPPLTTATTPNTARTQPAETERRTSSVTNERKAQKPEQRAPAPQPESRPAPAPADAAPQLKPPAEPPKAAPAPRTAMQQKPKAEPRSNEPKPKDELKAPKKKDEGDKKKDDSGGGGDNGGG